MSASAERRLLDLRRGAVGVSTFGNGAVSGAGVFFAFVGDGVPFDVLVVGDADLLCLVGEGDLLFVCRRGCGIWAMTSATPCFCSEVREVWTSGDLESSSNSAME